jgi:DNA-directed RNA polymerase specialized sigma24 family protein
MQHATGSWPPAEVLSELVRGAQSGNPARVEELLSILRPSLVSFFERRFAADVAEDLAQLSLVRLGGALGRIDPQRADVYVSTVARNLLRTAYRRNAREASRDGQLDPADLASMTPPVDARIEYSDLVSAVHRECLTCDLELLVGRKQAPDLFERSGLGCAPWRSEFYAAIRRPTSRRIWTSARSPYERVSCAFEPHCAQSWRPS